MSLSQLRCLLSDRQGIALPLALIVLTLLTSLSLAFLAMSTSEPMIATNLKRGEAALALAEAGIERAIWALSNPTATGLTDLTQIPTAYSGLTLFQIGQAGYSVALTGTGPVLITARGFVLRDGVALPAQPAQLAQADIAAQRRVQLQVTAPGAVGGPAAPSDMKLPGALTVAGSVQMSGNSLVDGRDQAAGTPNSCAKKGGVTIRDKTTLSDGTEINNTINLGGSASAIGTPAQQELSYTDFAPFVYGDAQIAALKTLAQQQGTYIQPTSSSQFHLDVVNGLMFIDTVNGQALGTPPDPSKLASVKITGANNSGWLIVMGSVRIDGNVTYNGFIYAHNDLSYKGTGAGGIFGGVLTGNMVDTVATVVDTDASGNSKIYFDCVKIANGGGALTQAVQDGLNRAIVTVTKGSWREASN
jgi:hypothetical protein